MKLKYIIVIFFTLFAFAIILNSLLTNTKKTTKKEYKVLHVSSYNYKQSWEANQIIGIKRALDKSRLQYIYKNYNLDSKTYPEPSEIQKRADKAKKLIKEWDPDVIIVSDDNAVNYVAIPMKNTKYKFVFSGINIIPKEVYEEESNLVGILERQYFEESAKILKILDKNIKKIIIICDNSPSSIAVINNHQKDIAKMKLKIMDYYCNSSFEKWQQVIKDNQDKVDAFLIVNYHILKDKDGKHIPPRNVINWIVNNSNIPEFSINDEFAIDGGLLTVTMSAEAHGERAAELAIEVLKKDQYPKVKVHKAKDAVIYINLNRANDFNYRIPPKLINIIKTVK